MLKGCLNASSLDGRNICSFSAKRTREHFSQIFKNRYASTSIDDLKHCSPDVTVALDNFYTKVDDLHWYLGTTQEMPNTVERGVEDFLKTLEKLHNILQLHVNAECSL